MPRLHEGSSLCFGSNGFGVSVAGPPCACCVPPSLTRQCRAVWRLARLSAASWRAVARNGSPIPHERCPLAYRFCCSTNSEHTSYPLGPVPILPSMDGRTWHSVRILAAANLPTPACAGQEPSHSAPFITTQIKKHSAIAALSRCLDSH